MACDPSTAVGALPIADRQPAGDRAPARLPALPKPLARCGGVEFCIMQRACHAPIVVVRQMYGIYVVGLGWTRKEQKMSILPKDHWMWRDGPGRRSVFSRRKHGFESRRARQSFPSTFIRSLR